MNIYFYKNKTHYKKLGQNFLIDENVIHEIISFINPQKTDSIIEIGPGLGALTTPLFNKTKDIIAIEIDSNLCKLIKKKENLKKIKIFNEDAATFNFFKIKKKKNNLFRICGNLPYNVSIPILLSLLNYKNIIKDMTFMFQREVAYRITAPLGSKYYNRLSIISQLYFETKIINTIIPTSFKPIPKIHSCLVSFRKKTNAEIYIPQNFSFLQKIIKIAFNQRRKVIGNSLSSIITKKELFNLSINPQLRAQNLSTLQYCTLSNYIEKKINNLQK